MTKPTIIVCAYRVAFPGGLEEVARQLIQFYRARGYSLIVVSTDVAVDEGASCGDGKSMRIRVYGPQVMQLFIYCFAATIVSWWIKRRQREAVVVSVGAGVFYGKSVAIVGSSHRSALRNLVSSGYRWVRWRPMSLLTLACEIVSLRCARLVVAPSVRVQRELLLDYGVRSVVVPHGVDLNVFHGDERIRDEESRDDSRMRHEKVVLLFVANECVRKGWRLLESVLCLLPSHYCCAIVGRCTPAVPDALAGRVQVLGVRTRSDVAAIMRTAHCLVVPSLYEPFGLVVPEAMACGLPVVVSACVGAADLVRTHGCGCVLGADEGVGTMEEWVRSVRWVCDDKARWKVLSKNAISSSVFLGWELALSTIDELVRDGNQHV